MSKTYWSQRIEELANSEKAVPDTAFFTSEAYRSYTETAAKDMITGVCGYLRRCGYSISEMEEDRRVNALAVEMLRNPEITAYTDGYNICIGTNNSLVTSLDSRELRHYAIQGFRVHEVAHILFTDFPTLKNWVGHLNQGIWWPKIPDRASEKDGVELTKRLKKPRFCKPFVSIARNIENARKKDAATEKVNREKNNELNEEARHISSEIGTKVTVDRAQEVSKSNVAVYNELSNDLLVVTKNLERRLKTMIRDEENDDTVSGLPMGSRVEARLAYHRDGKIFSRKNFPRDNPRLAVGYLCDESGSMRDDAIEASIRTGIIIQDLCYRMELPCYVCGFTTSGFGLQIINYVDQDIDGKDKYRITGMQSRSGTPTGPAMKYMAQKLKKETAEKRLLIVSTDGCSASGQENIQKTIKELSRYGILVVGAGIGSARAQVENEFGKNFIDIGNLEAMPQILCNIVKRNLA